MFFSDPAENAVAAINRLRDAPEEKTGDLNSTIANTAIVAERTDHLYEPVDDQGQPRGRPAPGGAPT